MKPNLKMIGLGLNIITGVITIAQGFVDSKAAVEKLQHSPALEKMVEKAVENVLKNNGKI